ncbi:redoxin domain-containing protein [Barnesiella viscericola]|uniref:Redoxin domain-containing protein n=1 Tax=Barnesiella viscericola TaxID=397865 RepID=A0A921SVD2_9BACT|nr:redoxin domain-containing protein [Barnesiella viscericola]HJG89528.1 redoxin domain-containing protein [Barnesiella viscericola]
MKKWIFLCAIALAVTACNKREFTIEGRVTDADGQILYLESLASGQPEVLESVALDKEGSFKFTQEAPQYPEFYQLRLNESLVHFAIDSTETLTFSARATDFADGYELTGSDECTKMRIVTDESGKLKKRINELSRAIESKSNQVDSLRQQAVQALADYKKKMFNLVLENPASATSYYIVFQEINGDKIFNPYNAEDRKLIAAVATGFDMRYPESPRSKQLKEMTLAAMASDWAEKQEIPDIEAETASYIDVELYDQLGRKQTLAEQVENNKVVLLSFTAYQTEYSPAYNMKLAELYKRYKNRGLEIYQISFDADEQAWKVAADNLPWVCVRDPQTVYSSYASMYNVKTLPTCFVIDKNDGVVKRIEKVGEIESAIQSRL